jgi:translation elongation factor EF-G
LDGVLNYFSYPTEAINEEKISLIDTLAHVDFTVEAFGSVLIFDNDVVDGVDGL